MSEKEMPVEGTENKVEMKRDTFLVATIDGKPDQKLEVELKRLYPSMRLEFINVYELPSELADNVASMVVPGGFFDEAKEKYKEEGLRVMTTIWNPDGTFNSVRF